MQCVAKHGYEQYLAKYISKAEPSFNIDLPNNASDPQRYLRTRVIGSVEAIEVLMSFHQSQMTRQVLCLPTEIKPRQRMLKSKRELLRNDTVDDGVHVMILLRCMRYEGHSIILQNEVQKYFESPSR